MVSDRRRSYSYRDAHMQRPGKRHWALKIALLLAVFGAVAYSGLAWERHHSKPGAASTTVSQTAASSSTAATAKASTNQNAKSLTSQCTNNASGKLIMVSIGQRHLWACNGASVAYDSAVITGMENLAADLTPTGTYRITSKTTNTHLIGSDSTGHWDDFVNYWMPFLHNKYGTYGFHDATWRDPSAFGNISPNSTEASHGCVETPLGTAKWLYNWAPVGTGVTIES